MGVFEKEFTVQFGDVDMQNRLTLKGAYRLMQEAANCHSDQAGYGINNIEKTDYSWEYRAADQDLVQRRGRADLSERF